MEFKYKGNQHLTENMEVNIETFFRGIPIPDFSFYESAFKFCEGIALIHSTSPEKVAGVVAALSPMKQWDENKKLTEDFFRRICPRSSINSNGQGKSNQEL